MPRLTVTISDEHERILERQADGGEAYRSKSEVIRECIEAHERVEELSEQLARLEAEVELLRDQRAELTEKAVRIDELESRLRRLQTAYHRAISEGRSPRELEPIVETPPESSQSVRALIEEAESAATESTTIEETTAQPQAVEAAETVESSTAPDAGSAGSAPTAETNAVETGRTVGEAVTPATAGDDTTAQPQNRQTATHRPTGPNR